MQKFSVFQRSVLLAASPEEVFSFHEDPRNIRKISPPSLRVEKVACSVPARVGDEFQLTVRQFGIRLEWIGFWEEIDRGHKLTDGAIKSPFLHWRHQHRFEPAGRDAKETLMTDRVE